jgi:DNA polymerase III sliding clamp (beta) subunit (PCNA family)
VFYTNDFVFTTRLTNGNLNNIEELMQKIVPKYRVTVDSHEFSQAVDCCMTMTNGFDSCVDLKLKGKSLVLSVDNENGNSQIRVSATVSADMQGEVFHYKPAFILDSLKSCKGSVIIEFNDKGIMKVVTDSTEYVIMPRKPAIIKKVKPVKEKTAKKIKAA